MASDTRRPKLVVRDADPAVQLQTLAVYTVDAAGKVLSKTAVSDKGDFDLTPEAVSKASRVVVARAAEGTDPPDLTNAVSFHAFEVSERLKAGEALEIGPNAIGVLFPPLRCADGTVRHCFPFPLAVQNVVAELKQNALSKLTDA